MFYGGVDVAKYCHEVCLVDDAGDVVLQMHMDNNQRGMNKLLQALERLGIEPDGVKFCFGEERARKIQSLAKGSFGITLALDAFTLQLRLLVEQIEFIEEQIKVIEDAINEVAV